MSTKIDGVINPYHDIANNYRKIISCKRKKRIG
jgi:hypothetical protein